MTAQCQAQHGLRADRFQAYFLARKVRRNYFPHVSTVMWPTPRRALNAGTCGVEVEGGRLPTSDWMLNLQILTSGGYQCTPDPPHH